MELDGIEGGILTIVSVIVMSIIISTLLITGDSYNNITEISNKQDSLETKIDSLNQNIEVTQKKINKLLIKNKR